MLAELIQFSLDFMMVTTADGRKALVNPHEIVAIRPPRSTDHFVAGAKCLIFTTDGKFLSAGDSCEDVMMVLRGILHVEPVPAPPIDRH